MGTVADDLGPDPPARPGTWPPTPRPAAAEPTVAPESPSPAPVPFDDAVVPDDQVAPAPAVRERAAPTRSERRAARVAVPRVAPTPAPAERRYRQTVNRIDLWSVLKISVCFYICAMAVTMVALVALWVIADAAGVIHSVEKFLGDLLQTKDFTFLSGEILRGALLVAAVLVVLLVVITVIAAAFYNMFAELFGGVELTITEEETSL
jgi:hypothetical protein